MDPSFDRLEESCREYMTYPTNLIRTKSFPHSLQSYQEKLNTHQSRLFDPKSEFGINFWDRYDGQEEHEFCECRTIEELCQHLGRGRKDPRSRYVFIQADNSWAPLDCSRAMMEFLFSFHQVMATFLDAVLLFGRHPNRIVPTTSHQTVFRYEHYGDSSDAQTFKIRKLGRSGHEIQHCYNLWSVERSDALSEQPWAIRQTAIFHSFDIGNGRALWINIKANDLMEKRISKAVNQVDNPEAGSLKEVSSSFAATLTTHLIHFEWCDENWHAYMDHWERELNDILVHVESAPIHKIENELAQIRPSPDTLLSSKMSSFSPMRVNSGGYLPGTFSRSSTRKTMETDRVSVRWATPIRPTRSEQPDSPISRRSNLGSPPPNNAFQLNQNRPKSAEHLVSFEVLQQFRFQHQHKLHYIGTKLEESTMVMHMNIEILNQVVQYYRTFVEGPQSPDEIRLGCQDAVLNFLQRTELIVRNLQMERSRIETLMQCLEHGRSVYDAIIQFRNMEINQLLAANARESSERIEAMTSEMHASTLQMEQSTLQMENIASKTEKETSSMHIITLVTLIFLPGTFVATFLGSGLFQWPETGGGEAVADMPVWRPEYFVLFAKICFPLMGGTILVWLAAYFWKRVSQWCHDLRSWRINKLGNEEAGYHGEK